MRALARPGARDAPRTEGIERIEADLCSTTDLSPVLDGVDAVVHLATRVRGSDREIWSESVRGTERIAAAISLSTVRRVLHASSLSVYDWRRIGDRLDEDSPVGKAADAEADVYARTKRQQEAIMRSAARRDDWRLTVLRPGAVWGPGSLALHEIGYTLGPWQVVIASRRHLRIVYVDECAEAFATALESDETIGGTFNLVASQGITAWRYAGAVGRLAGQERPRVPIPYWPGRLAGGFVYGLCRLFGTAPRVFTGTTIPYRYLASFHPALCSSDRLVQLAGWSGRSFDCCLDCCTAELGPRP